jgi:hypothetical protein
MASKLYTFHPEIYPRALWIQVGFDIPEGFEGVTVEDNDSAMAVVNKAYDKKSNKCGCMIRFMNLKAIDLPNVTHESIHVAMDIFGYCGIVPDNNNQEPLCYLAGWVAKCCKEVLDEEYCKIQKPSQDSDLLCE